jgi:sugar lactone lactonase YvrE
MTALATSRTDDRPRSISAPYPVVANIDFPEGPTFDDKGNLYFVNYVRNGTIGCMEPDGSVRVWRRTDGLMLGLKCDGRGGLVATDYGRKRIVRFELEGIDESVLTYECDGHPYKGPNDLCFDRVGNLYFSDPGDNFTEAVGAIYKREPSGAVYRLDDNLRYPNGIAVSPDQDRLFVSETATHRILAYDLRHGSVANRRVFHEFRSPGVDGIMFDTLGRLWVARWRNGTVDCLDGTGKFIASLEAGGHVTNLCWWGNDLYVTVADRHSIHKLAIASAGRLEAPDPRP